MHSPTQAAGRVVVHDNGDVHISNIRYGSCRVGQVHVCDTMRLMTTPQVTGRAGATTRTPCMCGLKTIKGRWVERGNVHTLAHTTCLHMCAPSA